MTAYPPAARGTQDLTLARARSGIFALTDPGSVKVSWNPTLRRQFEIGLGRFQLGESYRADGLALTAALV